MSGEVDRRQFIGGAAALGALGLLGTAGPAPAHGGRHRPHGLPPRESFVIRGAYVLSMDPAIGDLGDGDVAVRDGRITGVGRRLHGGRVIDGRGTIVMPGLIDTHWHLWTALHRSMANSSPTNGYFALNVRLGTQFRPEDIYQGARLALAEALNSGITTVHDWSHNIRGPQFADANLRAHQEVGLRGRFSYGTPQGHPATATIDLADFERVHREWFRSGRLELVHLGLAGRPFGVASDDVVRTEYAAARRLGLPVSYHANSNRAQGQQANIQRLADAGMLGRHVQVIHALYTTAAERQALASTQTSVSISPWSELLIGYGVTTVKELVDAGVLLNLSVDTLPLTGNADMFSIIKLVLGLHRGQSEQEFSMLARRALAMATIDAARGLGLEAVTGSLTPGKRADLIMVRADALNMAPFTDAPNMVALAAQPANVDTVVVDGRVLKRDGRLTALNPREVVVEASAALERVLARAGGAGGAARPDDPAHFMCC
jgi:cytosine/adenosine deaminase-related metal-dependent hydrolase